MVYQSHPKSSGLWDVALFIARFPYFIPFSGWFWFGVMVVNYASYPFWVYCLLMVWSLISSQAAPQSMALIKKDIEDNNGWITSQMKIGMLGVQLLQWPTVLAVIYAVTR